MPVFTQDVFVRTPPSSIHRSYDMQIRGNHETGKNFLEVIAAGDSLQIIVLGSDFLPLAVFSKTEKELAEYAEKNQRG